MPTTRLGVDLGGTKLLVISDTNGSSRTERISTGPEFAPRDLLRVLRRLIDSLPARPASIGIAVPGLIAEHATVVACDVLPRFAGWSAAAIADLADRVHALNDAEAALLAESSGTHDGDAALVMVGTRIGAAFTSGGHIVRGARGWAGELGYLPVRDGDVQKTLDDVASGEALTRRFGIDGLELRDRVERNDPDAAEAVRKAGHWLGIGLGAVINLLNPGLLLIGGGTARLPGYLDAARHSAESAALPESFAACVIREVADKEDVVARGALLAAWRE